MKTVFVNPTRCIGCLQCEFACAVAHSQSQDPVVALSEQPRPYPRIHVEPGPRADTAFPTRCRHCDPAPCVQVCPTSTLLRDDEVGLVLADAGRCIGCAMCAMVCPFDAITFQLQAVSGQPARVAVHKCDGCVDRVRAGREPACAEVCMVDALVYGEVNALVRAGRVRQSAAVLTANESAAEQAPAPDPLSGWRALGEAIDHVSQEVAREPHSIR